MCLKVGRTDDMNHEEEVKLTHSGILASKGRKHVSVCFERGKDTAEGSIPECRITKNHGFSDEEVEGLEGYLEQKCDEIFAKAKAISNIKHWF